MLGVRRYRWMVLELMEHPMLVKWLIPSGKRLHNELKKSTIFFHGKMHSFDWAMASIAMLVYQMGNYLTSL